MKLSFLLGCLLSTFIYLSAQTETWDWSDHDTQGGNWMSTSLTYSATNNGTDFSFSIADPAGALATSQGMPLVGPFYQGDQIQPSDNLLYAVSLQALGTTNKLTTTIDVGDPGIGVDNLTFKLFDIDGEPASSTNNKFRQEEVTVVGYLNGQQVLPTLVGTTNHTVTGNSVIGINSAQPYFGGSGNLPSAMGVVQVIFPSAVDQVVFDWGVTSSSIINPTSAPGFGLFDINYDNLFTVALLSMDVIETNGEHLLQAALYENDFISAHVEQSLDGAHFTTISSDLTSPEISYILPKTDRKMYYRLRWVDARGQTNYSSVFTVDKSKDDYSISFNGHTIQAKGFGGEDLRIVNTAGQIVYFKTIIEDIEVIDISDLSTGVYFVSSASRVLKKIVKE